jgi:hypothetical protein
VPGDTGSYWTRRNPTRILVYPRADDFEKSLAAGSWQAKLTDQILHIPQFREKINSGD